MPKLTPVQMAAALNRQMKIATNEALNARYDELAVLQRVMFMELMSFARDGATSAQVTELINFLSVMQYLAENESRRVASPVMMPEFRDSVKRALCWFKTFESKHPANQKQMIDSWLGPIEEQGQAVIWALVLNLLKKHEILTCSLAQDMVITIYAVADVFTRRFSKLR